MMKKIMFICVVCLVAILAMAQPGPRIPGKPIVFTPGDTTPSVRRGMYFKTNNSTATTIIRFDSTSTGDEFMVEVTDNNTTLKDTTWIDLPADLDITFKSGDIFQCKEQSGVSNCWILRLK